MPQRDYIARKNNKGNKTNKTLIVVIVFLLLIISAMGLWLLKESTPAPMIPVQQNQPTPQTTLPTPPQETWSYIRELESRNVPVDNNPKSQAAMAQLTEEQLRLAEQKRQQTKQIIIEPVTPPEPTAEVATTPTQDQVAQQQAETAKQAAEAKRLAEERRKQAERRKQEASKKAEQAKAEQPKTAKLTETKASEAKPQSTGRFGLQCGAYKNKAQAENMQARLAMAGYNARINVSSDWNRVVVGPIGDRAAATRAHANARSVAECVVVAM